MTLDRNCDLGSLEMKAYQLHKYKGVMKSANTHEHSKIYLKLVNICKHHPALLAISGQVRLLNA